jgi:hypothetical protein
MKIFGNIEKINFSRILLIDIIIMILNIVILILIFHSIFYNVLFSEYISKSLYFFGKIFLIKIIIGFILLLIILFHRKLIKTKLYFLIIPQMILSIYFLYVFIGMIIINKLNILDYLILGYDIIITVVFTPIFQIFWINTVQNKKLIILSNIISPILVFINNYGIILLIFSG